MKKIAFYSPAASEPLGHPIYAQNLCPILQKKYSTVLYTLKHNELNAILKEKGIKLQINNRFFSGYAQSNRFTKYGKFAKIIARFYFMKMSYGLIKDFYHKNPDADVYHLFEFEYLSTFLFYLTHNALLRKTVLCFHSTGFHWIKSRGLFQNIYKGVLLARPVKWMIHKAKGTSVMTDFHRTDFLDSLKLEKVGNKIRVTGWGNEQNAIVVDRKEARRKLGLKNEQFYGLFFGVIRESKGFRELINCFEKFDPKISLLVAGSPWDIPQDEINEMLGDLVREGRCIANIGFIAEEEIKLYYGAADFVFLPHKGAHTGFSGPLSLAIQYQRPVVAPETGQIGEFVRKYEVGSTFKSEDWDDFVLKTREIVCELEDGNYSEKRFLKALDENSWNSVASRVSELYELN